jgi:hypothetical protein
MPLIPAYSTCTLCQRAGYDTYLSRCHSPALKRAAVSRGVNTYDKFTDYTRLFKQGLVSPGVCGVS